MLQANKTCLVLDLDDTLYFEVDYQTSGLQYVESQIRLLYGVEITGKLVELRDQGCKDVFAQACQLMGLPLSLKDTLIQLYRFHYPNICLSAETKFFLKKAKHEFSDLAILTDGRSVTQRLKLKALGLENIPCFISEEWGSAKPEKKRFLEIQREFTHCSDFCYVGDNPSKDFVAPNELDWVTVGLKGSLRNIHSQSVNGLDANFLPDFWITQLEQFFNYVKY